MEGTTITSKGIIEMYESMFLKMSSGTEEYSDVWDIKPPLFHVRYPRKLKKRMKKCNLLKG